jgi:hypothetical protein
LPIPTDPPASTLVRQPDRWRSRLPRRSRSSARASNPGPSGGHLEDLAMACRTCPQSGWPPTSARVRPPDTRLDTVSADQSPLRTPGSRWPGGGHGGPLDRPVGRTSPVRGDRPADGSGPGPDSGGQAADTSSAQRPTMPLASRPRPTTRPARPGPLSRQDGNAHARLRPIPAATSIGTARRDHLRPCSMPERPQAWSPSDVRAVVSGVHDGHPDRTGFGHRPPRRIRPDTVHSTRHAMANQKRRGQGTDERHRRRSDILDRHHHKAAHRDTPSPLLWGRRLRLGNQGWLGDGKTASTTVTTAATRQLLGVAPPSRPRLGALLSSDDYGSSVERTAKLHPLWRCG